MKIILKRSKFDDCFRMIPENSEDKKILKRIASSYTNVIKTFHYEDNSIELIMEKDIKKKTKEKK